MAHQFGGEWTEKKLRDLEDFLEAYRKIFDVNRRAQYLKTLYVDAFAGSGYRKSGKREGSSGGRQPSLFRDLAESDVDLFRRGSPQIALDLDSKFDYYLFIEKSESHARKLEEVVKGYNLGERVRIVVADANVYLQEWAERFPTREYRAVVFLDPYGMQVEWRTLTAIAGTRAVDLWLLFPLGQAVNRMLTRNELPPASWQKRISSVFGNDDWKTDFYQTEASPSLFGDDDERLVKQVRLDDISSYFVKRMRTIFPYVAEPKPLRNSSGNPIYMLCFGSHNKAGLSIAQHLTKR